MPGIILSPGHISPFVLLNNPYGLDLTLNYRLEAQICWVTCLKSYSQERNTGSLILGPLLKILLYLQSSYYYRSLASCYIFIGLFHFSMICMLVLLTVFLLSVFFFLMFLVYSEYVKKYFLLACWVPLTLSCISF